MKLLWLDVNCSYAHSSLALPAIHAQCGDEQADWEAVSATLATPIGTLVRQIMERKPDVIAATAWLFNHDYLIGVLFRIKALIPEVTVVLGGPEFLGDNESFLRRNLPVDAVFRGDGKESFPRWLRFARDREQWKTIAGLCFLDAEGVYRDGGMARVKDFAALNAPEESRFFARNKPFVQLETTRGCFSSCTFCVSGNEKPVRTLPVTHVRRRLERIRGNGIREVRLLDRTFNGDWRRAVELLELFRQFPEMRFHLELHPALLPATLRQVLASMPPGMLHVEAGIQSLRESVLNICNRAGQLSEALDGLRFLCGLKNMETHADLIVGLPNYSLEHIFEDIHTLATFGAGEIQLELVKVLPGTQLRAQAEALGLVYSPLPPYEILRTERMPVEEVQTGRLLSRLLDFYYNSRVWHAVARR
ncbi:MAG: DUF4080 domain-containing protein, partial [Rikenellaceae bacterium]|nr:DUF4080 domain-containing protein [Rikenellaceae bacterium]